MGSDRHTTLAKEGLIHDLANVFQTILQAAALISSDEGHRENADLIVRCVERAERLLGVHDSLEPVLLRDSIEAAIALAHDSIGSQAGPALSFQFNGPDVSLRMRRSALDRALINLFINSAHATSGAGGRQVHVTLSGRFGSDGYTLTVADNGPGISEAFLGRVFTPRVSGRPGGEGLGLCVVRTALAECGGTIAAGNGENGGAVFTLFFPTAALGKAAAAGAGGAMG